jgi:tetratricopeptide (TPR) repeat protein
VTRAIGAGLLLLATGAGVGVYVYAAHHREVAHQHQILLGDTALAEGDSSTAVEAFSGAIALKPDGMIGYLRRGEAYHRRGELEAALKDLNRAVGLDPYAPRIAERLGDVNYELHRFERAVERYRHAVALDDQSPRVLYKLALAQFAAGQPEASAAALRRAIELDDRFAEAHYLLGLSLRDSQRDAEAVSALTRAVALAPGLHEARDALAGLYQRMGRVEDRIQELDRLRALDAGPEREVTLALAYARSGRTDYAVAALGRAMERYPDHPSAAIALGRVWLEIAEARNDHVALSKALGALENAPPSATSSEALTLLGRALLLAGDTARAERTLRGAAGQWPVEPTAFLHLATAAERLGLAADARDALLDYHALVGDDADARRRRVFAARVADLSARAGDPQTALGWYERAIDGNSADLGLLVRYATAQAAAGRADEARTTLAGVLEKAPAHREALALQRRLR